MIAVIGLGFVGITTALGFAYKGYKVYCFDIDRVRMSKLKKGIIPFYEPQLKELLLEYKDKRLILCDTIEEAVNKADIVIYCVGTPSSQSGKANLAFLKSAIIESLKFIRPKKRYTTLVIKSSVPPSATKEFVKPILEKRGFKVGMDIGLVNNPEFLREGFAWEDFIKPDMIIIGQCDDKSGRIVEKIYKPFKAPIRRVSLNTAEFIKYLSNTFLSNLISFSNEMLMAAEAIGGVDVPAAFGAVHLDKRWYGNPALMITYLFPGCGFGGYCLPKDVRAIYNVAKRKGYNAALLKNILSVNEKIKRHFVEKVYRSIVKNKNVGVLGLSFKPGCDDVRESPAKDIIKMLIGKGVKNIIAYDPMAMDNFKKEYKLPIKYSNNLEGLIKKCDSLVIITAWKEFKDKRALYKGKKVIDGRYFL